MPKSNKRPPAPEPTTEMLQEEEIESLKQTVSLYDKQMLILRREIQEENQKLDQLNENRGQAEKILTQMQDAYEKELDSEITEITPEIKETLDEQEAKRQEAEELYDKLKEEKQQHSAMIEKIEETINKLQAQNTDLRQQRNLNKEKAALLEQKYAGIAQIRRELTEMTTEMQNCKTTIDCYQELTEKRKTEDLNQRMRNAQELLKFFTQKYENRYDYVEERYNRLYGRPASTYNYLELLTEENDSEAQGGVSDNDAEANSEELAEDAGNCEDKCCGVECEAQTDEAEQIEEQNENE